MNPDDLNREALLQRIQQMGQELTQERNRAQNAWASSVSGFVPAPTLPDTLSQVARRIHRENGPAVYLDDGRVLYFWRGVHVPEWVIMDPDMISLDKILREGNIELRRILIERYGEGRFLKDLGAIKIHEDNFGTLWHVKRDELLRLDSNRIIESITTLFGNNRKLAYVQVKDPSSRREYFIPVPTTMRRAKQAIAWSFKIKEEEYNPVIET